jgi:hypothetical protein
VGGPQSRSGLYGEKKNLAQPVAIPTELFRLPDKKLLCNSLRTTTHMYGGHGC